jgi:sugar lactone lactonase YvrE
VGCWILLTISGLPAQEPPAAWQYPLDVAVGQDGTIYIADRKLPGLWMLKEGKSEILVHASQRFRTPLNAVRCVSVTPDGTLLAGDSATREVYQVAADGALTQLTAPKPALKGAKLSDNLKFTPDNFGLIGIPMSLAANSQGELYVADTELQRVWRVPKGGGEPVEFLVLDGPRGVAVDAEDHVWVLSLQAPKLQRVSPEGTRKVIIDDADNTLFQFPHQVALRPDGTAFVSDGYARTIWKVTPDGKVEPLVSGEPLLNPVGIRLRGEDVLIVDPRANALFSVGADGKLNKVYPPG